MGDNAVVRARIDERTKREAAAALKKIGLTLSDAFRLLLVRVAAEKALPFEPLNPNAQTVAAMNRNFGLISGTSAWFRPPRSAVAS